MGDKFYYSLTFDINHCWMRVPKDQLDTLVMDLQLDVINYAMLKNTIHLNVCFFIYQMINVKNGFSSSIKLHVKKYIITNV